MTSDNLRSLIIYLMRFQARDRIVLTIQRSSGNGLMCASHMNQAIRRGRAKVSADRRAVSLETVTPT